jgi:nicotinamide phosphoribosyltransferase
MLSRHREDGTYKTIGIAPEIEDRSALSLPQGWEVAMETVWDNGTLVREWTFAEVRARSVM